MSTKNLMVNLMELQKKFWSKIGEAAGGTISVALYKWAFYSRMTTVEEKAYDSVLWVWVKCRLKNSESMRKHILFSRTKIELFGHDCKHYVCWITDTANCLANMLAVSCYGGTSQG